MFAETVLSQAGHEVTAVSSGEEALELQARGEHVDIAFLTSRCHRWTATSSLKRGVHARPRPGRSRTPLIALTAFGFESHVRAVPRGRL